MELSPRADVEGCAAPPKPGHMCSNQLKRQNIGRLSWQTRHGCGVDSTSPLAQVLTGLQPTSCIAQSTHPKGLMLNLVTQL